MRNNYIVLDRDGVINVDLFDYVLENKTFEFEKGSKEAIAKLAQKNFKIIIATNQACINLGLISAEGIKDINNFWIKKVRENNGEILHVEVCPHKKSEDCNCRKPKTGLLESAEKKLNISLKNCFFIGDKLSDLECAVSHGCKPILVRTGYGAMTEADPFPNETKVFDNLKGAVDWIVD